ncbi:MAG: pantetheine-phosphate adenylyltransferase [Tidjanibacter sp.]|nr:pantetheine-phosphate adenylyltransferase [Tidjanibacter sp.]
MKTALFPGSFDPFTRGHQAVVEQALGLFDKVVIAIGENRAKRGFLTTDSRKRLIEDFYSNEPRVEVVVYGTLTGTLCRELGVSHIVRGVRSVADFEYERGIADANRLLFPEIETVMFFSPAEVSAISSSVVREVASFGGDTTKLLPEGIRLDLYLTEDN